MKKVLLGLACIALAGCATTAREPEGAVFGPDFSELTFHRDPATRQATAGISQMFNRLEGGPGGRAEQMALFTWVSGDQKTFPVRANEPITIAIDFDQWEYASSADCQNQATFTPHPSTRYDVRQRLTSEFCRIEIVDRNTGREPADISFPSATASASGGDAGN